MPKILYIEDELTKNIATIKKFFAPVLMDKRIKKELSELEGQDRVYPEDIIKACSYSSELEIAYTFPIALERISTNHKFYDLILIDRNLSVYDYSDEFENILVILSAYGMEFDQDRLLDFHEREGDLLLLLLLRINPEYKNKVYYLTANTKDDLRISTDLMTTMDLGNYQKDHLIEKGSEAENTISTILADMESFRIQNSYRRQCDILRHRLSEDDVNEFVEMVKHFNKDRRKEFVFYLRKLLDNLLHSIAFAVKDPDAIYWNEYNKTQLQVKTFIKQGTIGRLGSFYRKHRIAYNSIVRNACLSIFEICSDCGVHELSQAIDIHSLGTKSLSQYTMNSLMNQICDVIDWYDIALEIIKRA